MAINFPNSPADGATFVSNGVTFTYNSTSAIWTQASAATVDFTTIASNILPDADSSRSLGSATKKWKSLFLSSNTLFLGDSGSISAGTGGSIEMGSLKIGSGSGAVELTASSDGKLETKGTTAAGVSDSSSAASGSATVVANMVALVAITGMTAGQIALVTALNKVFMYTGSAWFLIATMTNASPTDITGVNATYALATDGSATVVTVASTDPEGFPLTFSSAVTTGSLTNGGGATATLVQGTGASKNVFTITPSTVEAYAGTFSITFSVTDGATGAVNAVSAFTLAFSLPTIANTVRFAAIPSPAPFNDASNDNGAVACSASYWARVQVRNINTKSQYLDVYNVSDNSLKFSVNLNIPNSYYNYTTLDICDNYVIVGEMSNTNGGGSSAPSYGQRGWVGKYSITDGSLTVAKTWTTVKGSSSERGFFGCQVKINTDETKIYVTAPRANFGTSAVGSVYILDSSLATVTEIANPNSGSYFGDRPVDSSGSIDCTATYWAIGHAQAVGSNRGNVTIYNNSNNTVFRTLGHPDGTGNGYNYGYSVEMDGDYIAIGSPNGNAAQYGQSTGMVYIYKISTGVMMTQIRVPGGYPVYMFGAQLAMNESTLCVGGNYGAAGEQYTAYDISAIATGDGSLNSGITLTGQGDTSLNNRIGGPMVANRSVANIVMGSSNDPFPGANPGNVALLANYGRGYVTILE